MSARSCDSSSVSLSQAITRLFGRRSAIAGSSISRFARFGEPDFSTKTFEASKAARRAIEQYYLAIVVAVTAALYESWPFEAVVGLLGRSLREPSDGDERRGRQDCAEDGMLSDAVVSLGRDLARSPELRSEIRRLADCRESGRGRAEGDLFKNLHHDLFARSWRHWGGEYYTPDWLAGRLLDAAGYRGISNGRLIDPACGSGTFLCQAVSRLVGPPPAAWSVEERRGLVRHVLDSVAGIDINPLAVWTARANLLAALRGLLDEMPDELPIVAADSILSPPPTGVFSRPFDFVVGNPPWIAWDHLPADYRNATKPLWLHYGLFSLGAAAARHGGAKKDLSMLMVYAAADRYLALGGRLAMVLPQIVFQSAGSGDGFRRFVLPDGTKLGVFRVDDYSRVRVFAASNWTCTVCIEKGRPTQFPVECYRWTPAECAETIPSTPLTHLEQGGAGCNGFGPAADGSRQVPDRGTTDDAPRPIPVEAREALLDHPSDAGPSLVVHRCQAAPVRGDAPGAPWIIQSIDSAIDLASLVGLSEYQAHLGANSGGANGIYWLRVVGKAADGVIVESVAPSKRGRAKKGERARPAAPNAARGSMVIEPDLLYPLVRWQDVDRFCLRCTDEASSRSGADGGRLAILLVQDPSTRTGIDESRLSQAFPHCYQYLAAHQAALLQRAAFRRYQAHGPYWSMYNVGPYTLSPYKVVWRRMDKIIRAVALGPCRDPLLGEKPYVPQETCVFVPCREADEAYYLAAILNSEIVGQLAAAQSIVGGKGFGTPGMFAQLNIRRFDRNNQRHQRLAFLAAEAQSQQDKREQAIREIDAIVRDEYLARARD